MNRLHILSSWTILFIIAAIAGCNQSAPLLDEAADKQVRGRSPATGEEVLASKFRTDPYFPYAGSPATTENVAKEQVKQEPTKRQIIFSADIQLTVKDFGKAEADLLQL